ncbi:Methylenetetrahydrofolate reductase 1 [Capsicum chinense]|nr:Methylenetetrahydrofolate reductase 1 [Capsicum chinense]
MLILASILQVDAGADLIINQLFYDTDIFLKFANDCRQIEINFPIALGIMPINNYKGFLRITGFCKTKAIENALRRSRVRELLRSIESLGYYSKAAYCKAVEISFAAKIPMQAIANALYSQESENSQEALRVLDIILRLYAAKQFRCSNPGSIVILQTRCSISSVVALAQAITANIQANPAPAPQQQGGDSTAARICDFMRINPPEFYGCKSDEDPRLF